MSATVPTPQCTRHEASRVRIPGAIALLPQPPSWGKAGAVVTSGKAVCDCPATDPLASVIAFRPRIELKSWSCPFEKVLQRPRLACAFPATLAPMEHGSNVDCGRFAWSGCTETARHGGRRRTTVLPFAIPKRDVFTTSGGKPAPEESHILRIMHIMLNEPGTALVAAAAHVEMRLG